MIIARPALIRPETLEHKQNPQDTCEHEWQKFKETVKADNPRYAVNVDVPRFYFIVKACLKCKLKQYLDYKRAS